MAYSLGGTIEATDYNSRVNTINSVWATGTSDSGYGQTALTTTAVGSTVTATQWATLISTLSAITYHQAGAGIGITQPTAGNTIQWLTTLDSFINVIYANRLNASITGAGVTNAIGSMSSATTWFTSSIKECTVTFSSTNAARYFFNTGGSLAFSLTQAFVSPQTSFANVKSADWASFYSSTVGTILIKAKTNSRTGTGGDSNNTVPGNPTPPTSNAVGYYNLTTVYQTLFYIGSTSATADYGNNLFTIEAKLGATPNIIQVRCSSYDYAADSTGTGNFNDSIQGLNTLNSGWIPPETTYITNTWGTPTFAQVTNTQS